MIKSESSEPEIIVEGVGNTCPEGCCAQFKFGRRDGKRITVDDAVSTLHKVIDTLMDKYDPADILQEVSRGEARLDIH